jgi:hypothetical protein
MWQRNGREAGEGVKVLYIANTTRALKLILN